MHSSEYRRKLNTGWDNFILINKMWKNNIPFWNINDFFPIKILSLLCIWPFKHRVIYCNVLNILSFYYLGYFNPYIMLISFSNYISIRLFFFHVYFYDLHLITVADVSSSKKTHDNHENPTCLPGPFTTLWHIPIFHILNQTQ